MAEPRVRYLLYLTIVSLFVLAGITFWVGKWVRNKDVYVAASIDKEQRLHQLPGQRLILVGGSNLAMGVASPTLNQATGVPVANMGLHANIGLSFMLSEAEHGLRKGDLVILCPEYELHEGDLRLLSQLVDINPVAHSYLHFSAPDWLRFYVQNLQRCLFAAFYKAIHKSLLTPVYHRHVFNAEGDDTAHYEILVSPKLADKVVMAKIDQNENIALINRFVNVARDKGAKVVLTYPPYCQSAYELNHQAIDDIERQYQAGLVCPILGKPQTFIMPDSLFFDTVYHPTRRGGQLRTTRLIDLLEVLPGHKSFVSAN